MYAYTRDYAAFKRSDGNIYKLARKALLTKNGQIFTPNARSFIGLGKQVFTENRKAHIEGGIVYVKKRPLHMQNLKNKILKAKRAAAKIMRQAKKKEMKMKTKAKIVNISAVPLNTAPVAT